MRVEILERLGLIVATAVATLAIACALASPPSGAAVEQHTVADADQVIVQAGPDSSVDVNPETSPSEPDRPP